jgi:hypothetical protein
MSPVSSNLALSYDNNLTSLQNKIKFQFIYRFVYEGQWRTKINAHVDFPVKGLDMSSFVMGPRPKPYKLYAVSVSNNVK